MDQLTGPFKEVARALTGLWPNRIQVLVFTAVLAWLAGVFWAIALLDVVFRLSWPPGAASKGWLYGTSLFFLALAAAKIPVRGGRAMVGGRHDEPQRG